MLKGRARIGRLTSDELEEIKRFIETTDIDVISDEMRALVETHWPALVKKLPPRKKARPLWKW